MSGINVHPAMIVCLIIIRSSVEILTDGDFDSIIFTIEIQQAIT